MKKEKYRDYKFDIDYEYRTYKNIGKDYGDSKTADRGVLLNCKRAVRKWMNKKEKRYKFCNKYSEWEKYIIEKYVFDSDMFHWLYGKKRDAETYVETIKVILIPIYLTMISVLVSMEKSVTYYAVIAVCFIVVMVSTIVLYGSIEKKHFLDDFVEVVKKKIE